MFDFLPWLNAGQLRRGNCSFHSSSDEDNVKVEEDRSLWMVRTEVMCSNCDAHLGHVFPDGPQPTGLRYWINSAALDLESED